RNPSSEAHTPTHASHKDQHTRHTHSPFRAPPREKTYQATQHNRTHPDTHTRTLRASKDVSRPLCSSHTTTRTTTPTHPQGAQGPEARHQKNTHPPTRSQPPTHAGNHPHDRKGPVLPGPNSASDQTPPPT